MTQPDHIRVGSFAGFAGRNFWKCFIRRKAIVSDNILSQFRTNFGMSSGLDGGDTPSFFGLSLTFEIFQCSSHLLTPCVCF